MAVEGVEDRMLFSAFLGHLHIDDVQVVDYGGKNHLRQWLKAAVRAPGFDAVETVVIIRDADNNADAALDSVKGALEAAALTVVSDVCVVADGSPRVMALIMPPQAPSGAIEDVCLQSVANDGLMECIDTLIACAEQQGNHPKNLIKARVQVFLAVQEEPGKRLGEAGQAGYWNFDGEPFTQLAECLKEAFD